MIKFIPSAETVFGMATVVDQGSVGLAGLPRRRTLRRTYVSSVISRG